MSTMDTSGLDAPSADTLTFAERLEQWLQSVKDSGTAIDTGGGFGNRDLWVKVGGHEFFISVTDRGPVGATTVQ